jgi:carbamate kinase
MAGGLLIAEGGPMTGLKRVTIALGGNALLRRGDAGTIEIQRHNLAEAARAIVELATRGLDIVVTHGNGPQVGLLALASEIAADVVPPRPLDVLGAESQGQIGYLLAQALRAAFLEAGIPREIAVILTQTVVDADDPAFQNPTKFVGPVYDEATARMHAAQRGWAIRADGTGWRRVVPSPRPKRIVEAEAVRRLSEAGIVPIASGGGGVPVVTDSEGRLRGVEGVVDKDLAAVALAETVGADALLLLTDVDGVYEGWGTPEARRIGEMSIDEASARLAAGHFPAGSMGPKVQAAGDFIRRGGRFVAIGSLQDATAILEGRTGTRIG